MKKILIVTVILCTCFISYAQDCSLEKRIDKFEDEVKINTRFTNVMCLKYIKNNESVYYLSLLCKGLTVNVQAQGVKILLKNGKKIIFPEAEIDVEPGDDEWFEYSAFIRLNEIQLSQLLSSPITDFKLYIYDYSLSEESGIEFIKELKCLISEK